MVTVDAGRVRDGLVALMTLLVAAAAVTVGVNPAAAGAAGAAPTGIDECTTITEPGVYELRADLSAEGETCLAVAASDVTVDGDGHTIARSAPDDNPPAGYGEPPALLVGGTDPVSNVTVTDATVYVESLAIGEVATDAVAYRNASHSTLANVRLESPVWSAVEVVGSNDTVRNVTQSSGVFRIDGDDNVLADSTASTGDDLPYATSVVGNRSLIENVTSLGDPGLRVVGREAVVRDSTVSGIYSPAATFGDAPNSRLVNNTVVSNGVGVIDSGIVLTNSSAPEVRGTTVEATVSGSGIALVDSGGGAIVDNDANAVSVVESDDTLVRGNHVGYGGIRVVGSASGLLYDNLIVAEDPVAVGATANASAGANAWNVTPRPGENVVGGDTLAGNYYASPDGTGFSQTCSDADGDDLCDSAHELGANNTDHAPLADAPGFPVPVVDGRLPADPDGDGVYEDVNGDGEVNYSDVVTFFEHVRDPAVRDHGVAYDFDGDGDATYNDVVVLFEEL